MPRTSTKKTTTTKAKAQASKQATKTKSGAQGKTAATRSPAEVVRLVGGVLKSVRNTFQSQNFIEVIPPTLEDVHDTRFVETLTVDLGEGRAVKHAQLSAGPTGYLESLLPHVGSVYAISPAFRGNRGPDWLMEFRYVQATGRGNLDASMKLATKVLSDASKALKAAGHTPGDHLKNLDPVKISYRKAAELVGAKYGQVFTQRQYLDLCAAHRNRPIFVVGVPLSVEPSAALGSRMLDEGPAFFELVVPYAGELGAGKEYEKSAANFRRQTNSSDYLKEAAANWHTTQTGYKEEELDGFARGLAELPSPSYSFTMGLERLTQFLLGSERITDAVVFPVTTDARTLVAGSGLLADRLRLALA